MTDNDGREPPATVPDAPEGFVYVPEQQAFVRQSAAKPIKQLHEVIHDSERHPIPELRSPATTKTGEASSSSEDDDEDGSNKEPNMKLTPFKGQGNVE